jgi:hypothetical protein
MGGSFVVEMVERQTSPPVAPPRSGFGWWGQLKEATMTKLTNIAQDIFRNVLDAMQNAEEFGGPEGLDYSNLMQAIADEARTRLRNFHNVGLTCFDDYEIRAEAGVWRLYGRIPGQRLELIGDFDTERRAAEIYARMTGRPYLRLASEGHRFRLVREVSRFPDFTAPAGLTGTVTDDSDGRIRARMDQPLPGAKPWDNELHWDSLGQFLADSEPCE